MSGEAPTTAPTPGADTSAACPIEVGGLVTPDRSAAWQHPHPSAALGAASIAYVRFEVPSFVNLFGRAVFNSKGWRRARTEFEVDGWQVVLDRSRNADDAYKDIRELKAHRVTHHGIIRKADGSRFSSSDLDRLLEDLYWLFSFICATRRGVSCWQAFDSAGRFIVEKLEGSQLGTSRILSWFPEGFENPFPIFVGEFMLKLHDPFWRDVMLFGIHILCESNLDQLSIESKMVLGQTALEMFATAILVEHLRQPNPQSAADGIRRLLNHICVPVAIPPHLTALASAAQTHSWNDGPLAITRIRNMLVHPNKLYRQAWLSISRDAKWQASLLSLHYTEMVMLWISGYDGAYVDRTDLPMMLGKHRTTPWAAGGSRP